MPVIRTRTAEILLVDDSQADVRLTREALARTAIDAHLSVVHDGEAALAFLGKVGQFATSPTPDLVLLDLEMPKMDGRELLAQVKGDPALRHIPVIVLSTSEAPRDIGDCYALGANAYVVKPADFDELVRALGQIASFWFGVAELPATEN